MDYSLQQRGRAAVDFLVDVGISAFALEQQADEFGRSLGLGESGHADDLDSLQAELQPKMHASPAFRLFRLIREWQLDRHGWTAMDAFDEMRADIETELRKLQDGPTQIRFADNLKPPDYWNGVEFHRSAGGWDGHDYMGFVHGEIIHRKMVGTHLADVILAQRAETARMAPLEAPERILEMGCGSAQYTLGLAAAFPAAELWGCDLSPRQLEQAQRRANERGLHWHLFEAAAEDTGLDGDQFDLVTSYAVFHELPHSAAREVLQETLRLLKPGGVTLVGDVKAYHVQDMYNLWKADFLNQVIGGDPYWRDYASHNLAALATEVGFADAKWAGVGDNHYPFVLTATKPR